MSTIKHFKKSTFSFDRDAFTRCVEVCVQKNTVTVRHSKNPSVEIEFTPEEWDAFLQGVKNCEFELSE